MKAIVCLCLIATLVANTFSHEYRLVGGDPNFVYLDKTFSGFEDGTIVKVTGNDVIANTGVSGIVKVALDGASAGGRVNEGGNPMVGADGSIVKDGTNLVLRGTGGALLGQAGAIGKAGAEVGSEPKLDGTGIVKVADNTYGGVDTVIDPYSAYLIGGGQVDGIVGGAVRAVVR